MSGNNTDNTVPALPKNKFRRLLRWAGHHRTLAALAVAIIIVMASASTWLAFKQDKPEKTSPNPIVASYQKQLPALAEAVDKNPKDAEARKQYAVALYATGKVGDSKRQYEAILKLKPEDATLRNNLGNVYRDLGDYNKAVSSYEKSVELDRKQTNAYVNLANLYLYILNKKDKAIQVYEAALDKSPENQDIMVLLAIAYEQSGDKSKATKEFRAVLDKNPDNAAALAGLKRLK